MMQHVADNVGVLDALAVDAGGRGRSRLGSAHRLDLGAAAAGPLPRRRRAVGALLAADRRAGRRRRSAASAATEEFYIEYFQQPGGPRRRSKRDVRGWLLGIYHSARATAPGPSGGTWRTSRPVRRCVPASSCPTAMPDVAQRRRPRRLRRRVRAQRLHRRAQPLPQHRPRLGGPAGDARPARSTCRRCSSAATATVPRSGARRTIERFPDTVPELRGRTCSPAAGTGPSRSAAEVDDAVARLLEGSLNRVLRTAPECRMHPGGYCRALRCRSTLG